MDVLPPNMIIIHVSNRGKFVADYIAIPHDCVRFCVECHVKTTTDLLAEHDLFSLLSDRCKAPDHSLVLAAFDWSSVTRGLSESTHLNDLGFIKKKSSPNTTK